MADHSEPPNVLLLVADQFTRDLIGCYGGKFLDTPHLDALGDRGAIFERAYTPSPICVPARAALHTGRPVHQIGCWDNGFPYRGKPLGWAHHLARAGRIAESIGKLHFGAEGDSGFGREHQPMHVVDGTGDRLGWIRHDAPRRPKRRQILQAGPGHSSYLRYDKSTTDQSVEWLQIHRRDQAPWALMVSLACPHPPYRCPPHLYDKNRERDLPHPPQSALGEWPDHPAIRRLREFFDWTEPFSETEWHNLAAAYYGAAEFVDQQVGRILAALDQQGMTENTLVVFTSDHGEDLGARGLFGKFTMYEESVGVPLILAGPAVKAGQRCSTPVTLCDVAPTIIETMGVEAPVLPGRNLITTLSSPPGHRYAFSEYHALGSTDAMFMIADQHFKYIHYVNDPAQLFDLENDPSERHNVIDDPDAVAVRQRFESALAKILDPVAVNQQAHADQARATEAAGGRETLLATGFFEDSPVPGETASFFRPAASP